MLYSENGVFMYQLVSYYVSSMPSVKNRPFCGNLFSQTLEFSDLLITWNPPPPSPVGGLLPYMDYVGMCGPKG